MPVPKRVDPRPDGRAVAGLGGFGRTVAATTLFNVGVTAVAGLGGIVIARSLGPSVRGEYAAINAWFGVLLIVGELGLPAATTFFVAGRRSEARHYVATSRVMMLCTGALAFLAGMLAAPALAGGDDTMLWGYRILFGTCVASFVGASYTFALQASSIVRWNIVRISQPALFLGCVVMMHLAGVLTLLTALVAVSVTTVLQTVVAQRLCARAGLGGGRPRLRFVRPMGGYGLGQLASTVPTMLTSRLDQLVLSMTVAPAMLGHYAVASTLTGLAVPFASALGFVAFPRLAARTLSPEGIDRLHRAAVLTSLAIGAVLMLALAVSASWLVPAIFGPMYRDAVPLVWLLTPGGIFLASGQVCGDLLRGHGRPLGVARAQIAAAVATVVLLAAFLPFFGAAGAAVASSVATGIALIVMIGNLRRLPDRRAARP